MMRDSCEISGPGERGSEQGSELQCSILKNLGLCDCEKMCFFVRPCLLHKRKTAGDRASLLAKLLSEVEGRVCEK